VQDGVSHDHTQPLFLHFARLQGCRLHGCRACNRRTRAKVVSTSHCANSLDMCGLCASRVGTLGLLPAWCQKAKDGGRRQRSCRPALRTAAHLRDERGRHKRRVQRQAAWEGSGQVRVRALDAQLRHGVVPALADCEALRRKTAKPLQIPQSQPSAWGAVRHTAPAAAKCAGQVSTAHACFCPCSMPQCLPRHATTHCITEQCAQPCSMARTQ
jgi:hypothetical protein